MNIEHTAAPWAAREQGEANQFAILNEAGAWVAAPLLNGEQMPERQRANMRRIVACVNACEGVATQALEHDGVGSVKEATKELIAALLRINAALEAAVCVATPIGRRASAATGLPTDVYHPAVEACRRALAEVAPLIAAITDMQGPAWAERH